MHWDVPETVLCLKLAGRLTNEEFHNINKEIVAALTERHDDRPIALVVDTLEVKSIPPNYSQLNASQTYANRDDIKYLMIIGKNKLIRLMMLLIYNLCRARLRFSDDYEGVWRMLKHHNDRYSNAGNGAPS